VLIFEMADAMAGQPNLCLPGAMAESGGDEVTQLAWAEEGALFTGHISGKLRRWQLPEAEEAYVEGTVGDGVPAGEGGV
jgi:hypothetical protein